MTKKIDRVLVLERIAANLIMLGLRNFANLWLLPAPALIGERIGLHAESSDDGWWFWFYGERCGLKVPRLEAMRAGPLGTVKLERSAAPRELGKHAHGPAVWVFSDPRVERFSGRELRAGYGDQPHVRERDRLALGSAQKGK